MGVQAALSRVPLGGLLVLLAAASCGSEPEPVPAAVPARAVVPAGQPRPALPGRAAIAGVPGFRIVCGIRFRAAPADPHQLEIVQVFPARSYWCLSRPSSGGLERAIDLLAGPDGWRLEPGAPAAKALGPAARADLELRSQLRSALVLWPQGFAWRSDPAHPGAQVADVASLGRIFTSGTPGEAPTLARAERLDGSVLEELRDLRWERHEGRSWPAQAELWVLAEHVWTERLESASTRVSFQDEFFLPRVSVDREANGLSPAEDGG